MGLERLLENTPEAYYWIGFLMADGSIDFKKTQYNTMQYTLTLQLSIKDIKHLKKYAKFIDRKIKLRDVIGGFRGLYFNKISYQARVRIQNSKIISKIIKKFNFKKRKTYNPPVDLNIKNNDLFASFIIGFIDGDGSIFKDGRLSISCNFRWEKILNKWVERIWKLAKCKSYNKFLFLPKCKIIKGSDETYQNKARIDTRNYQFIKYLKDKSEELNLPILNRKWDRVKNKNVKHNDMDTLIKKIRKNHNRGLNNEQIAEKLKISSSYVSMMLTRYIKNGRSYDKKTRTTY